eukprot:CAMPEP_0197034854 /NCGR_PEP_ID=MMETSP1384-20130603/12807_1 /TAXON_ID=29189 /ORGANISM="Ammonia sp." /LENGTH=337 /DNA_ID=CAMNT_0042464823 /DNA_START=65 /DNA_END=1078 /DNA_ORIENTATION=-
MNDLIMKFKTVSTYSLMNKGDPNVLTLASDNWHRYNLVHIGEGCTLTVKPWKGRDNYKMERTGYTEKSKANSITPEKVEFICSSWNDHRSPLLDITQLITVFASHDFSLFHGGKLLLECSTLIIEKGGKIDVDSCGYTSGTYYTSGESITDLGRYKDRSANIGGGGAGLDTVCGGGGAGYGTKGDDGKHGTASDDTYGLGGHTYGDKYLHRFYLGSGGGGSLSAAGGDGGGAIYIKCDYLRNDGFITANGGDAELGAGAGSGGSIHIVANTNIDMDKHALIQARGGKGGSWGLYGNGGHGRIRIDVNSNHYSHLQDIVRLKRINPPPFVTSMGPDSP